MPDPVEHQRSGDDDARELQDGDLVPGLRHAAQARRAALQRAGEGREGFVGIVDDVLVPRVVVDVDRHAPQRGDFGG